MSPACVRPRRSRSVCARCKRCSTKFLRSGDRKHLDACGPLREETQHWMGEAERLSTTLKETELMSQARRGYEQFFHEFDGLTARTSGILDQEGQDEVERLI